MGREDAELNALRDYHLFLGQVVSVPVIFAHEEGEDSEMLEGRFDVRVIETALDDLIHWDEETRGGPELVPMWNVELAYPIVRRLEGRGYRARWTPEVRAMAAPVYNTISLHARTTYTTPGVAYDEDGDPVRISDAPICWCGQSTSGHRMLMDDLMHNTVK